MDERSLADQQGFAPLCVGMHPVEDVERTFAPVPDGGVPAHVGVVHPRPVLGGGPARMAWTAEEDDVMPWRNVDLVSERMGGGAQISGIDRALAKNAMPTQGDPHGSLVL